MCYESGMVTALLVVLVALVVVTASAIAVDRLNYRAFLADASRAQALAHGASIPPGPVAEGDLAALPAPVRRYLERAGVVGRPRYRFARVRHGGFFRPSPKAGWLPIRGEYLVTADPPSFVWCGKVQMPFGLAIVARDSCVEGRGRMLVRLASAVPLGRSTGPAIDESARGRLVSEVMLLPTALLPGPYLRWEAIDEASARLVVRSVGAEASGVITFGGDDLPSRIVIERTHERHGRVPWTGEVRSYREFDGIAVCEEIEGAWNLPEGDFCYVRFRVTEVHFEDGVPGPARDDERQSPRAG